MIFIDILTSTPPAPPAPHISIIIDENFPFSKNNLDSMERRGFFQFSERPSFFLCECLLSFTVFFLDTYFEYDIGGYKYYN
jgi:hypothetical protein